MVADHADARLTQLREAVRERIGEPARQLTHTCDVLVDEACKWWPEREFIRIASAVENDSSQGKDAIHALGVLAAKVREMLEARWGQQPTFTAAIDLLVEPVVVHLANIWFSSPEARIAMRQCILRIRSPKGKKPQQED